jgi:hypothetical protein
MHLKIISQHRVPFRSSQVFAMTPHICAACPLAILFSDNKHTYKFIVTNNFTELAFKKRTM